VRNTSLRNRRAAEDDETVDRPLSPRPWWWRLFLRRPRDTLACTVAAAAATAIIVNAAYLQHGRHPAPIFAVKPLPIATSDARDIVGVLPRAHQPEPARHEPARPHGESADAKVRPHGDNADAKARPHGESAEAKARPPAAGATPRKDVIADLLGHPAPTPPASVPTPPASAPTPPASAPTPPAPTPPARLPAQAVSAQPSPPAPIPAPPRALVRPSRQVLAVQRALSEYGYGQLKPSGVYDADTRLAIQRFERDRKLPITGEISERLTRELANLTGHELN